MYGGPMQILQFCILYTSHCYVFSFIAQPQVSGDLYMTLIKTSLSSD